MDVTLKYRPNARKNANYVVFDHTDRPGSVQFVRSLFGERVPETVTVSGEFAAPKAKLTKEERAAARKAMTPEQKIAEAEARVARLKAKLAAAAAQPAA